MTYDENAPIAPARAEQPVDPVDPVDPVQPGDRGRRARSVRPVLMARDDSVARIVYLILGILETLLLIRLLLKLLAANPDAGFSSLIYGLTAPFVAPFQGVFPDSGARGSVLELSTILAMIVYAPLAWGIVTVARIVRDRRATPMA